jgi:N-acetylglutamate synthase-like GNAT family acetyltransferase
MEGPKSPTAKELPELMSFLDSQLRKDQGWSLSQEYPLVFDERNRHNLHFIKDEAKFVSHAAVKELIIRTPVGLFKAGAIGSVVTDPAYRNQGLSAKLIESCTNAATQMGCDFAILWTDLFDFYRKFDFELAGTENSFVINKSLGELTANCKVLESTKISIEAIMRLYSQHTVTTVRNAEDFRRFLSIPNTRVFSTWDNNNHIQAYAVIGKGADLTNYVHEWGGKVSQIIPLLSKVREITNQDITIILPPTSQNLISHLNKAGLAQNKGFLGMIKVLNHEDLFFKILRYSRAMGLDDFNFIKKDQDVLLRYGRETYKINSASSLTRLIFGPDKPVEVLGDARFEKLNKVLPIPMWVWGWDSV